MKNLVVFGARGTPAPFEEIIIDGAPPLRVGIVETAAPSFDPAHHPSAVLVRVQAFSCNYRDRTFLHCLARAPADRFFPIGSEFVAEVVAVGDDVNDLAPGDRVIPDHHYLGGEVEGEGVITNKASRELQVFPAHKLLKIAPGLNTAEAAAFSLGAQTAYSMVRKAEVRAGDRVLVTSAGSNTSLFLVQALGRVGAVVHAATSNERHHARLRALGVAELVDSQHLGRLNGLHAVFDPFFDLHLPRAVDLLRPFGRYLTCGLAAQSQDTAGGDLTATFARAIVRNLSLVGNCLGLREDLERALVDQAAGALAPVMDSVFGAGQEKAFLARTFCDRQRFGKVVYQYDARPARTPANQGSIAGGGARRGESARQLNRGMAPSSPGTLIAEGSQS